MLKIIAAALTTSVLALLAGCSRAPEGDSEAGRSDMPVVVCTVAMIADVVQEIAGDHVEVRSLMGAGTDPHLYKPNRTDIERLLEADLVLYNGLHLEGKFAEVLERVSDSGTPVVAVAELIDESMLLTPDGAAGQADPHVWMDPTAWTQVVGVISDSVAAVRPSKSDEIRSGADRYADRLAALHDYSTRVLGSVPEDRRVLVTAHDAFEYFGTRYGYEVVGIQGISTESEAGVRDIERIVDLLVERGIPAVFVESTVSDRNVRALIEGAAAEGLDVVIGGSLFSDAMGEAGTYRGTYIGMIDHNVTSIARALGGDAEPGGMDGNLTE